MKKYYVLIALLLASAFAHADGFGWHANTVSNQFFESLMAGVDPSNQQPYQEKVNAFISQSIQDDNFPYAKEDVESFLLPFLNRGLQLELNVEYQHEIQWFILDALLSPPAYFDDQMEESEIQSVGEQYVSPYGVRKELRTLGNQQTFLSIFMATEVFGYRYESGNCIVDMQYGLCLYGYIFLNPTEVRQLYEEVRGLWQHNTSDEVTNLSNILSIAVSNGLPLVFFGAD